jgi:hypothetical protein
MRLTCIQGTKTGHYYTGNDLGCVVGRGSGCDVVIDDEHVSREHARLYRDGNDYFITDLGSQVGTRVNGLKISRPQRISAGDHLLIGKAVLSLMPDNEATLPEGALTPGGAMVSAGTSATPPPARLEINPLFWVLAFLILAGIVWLILPSPQADGDEDEIPGLVNEVPNMTRPTSAVSARPRPTPPSPSPKLPESPEPVMAPGPLPADYLYLQSTPPGATVKVDGTERGQTPLLLANLPDGRLAVELQAPGYDPLRRVFELPADGGV